MATRSSATIDWEALPWQSPASGVRVKAVHADSRHLRLIEFAPAYEEPTWCESPHAFVVLEGSFSLQFRDHREHFAAGATALIPGGAAYAHRALLGREEAVRLLVFETDCEPAGSGECSAPPPP